MKFKIGLSSSKDVFYCYFLVKQSCGRLMYASQNEWVHVNCALWSAEVFEKVDRCLQNVYAAL